MQIKLMVFITTLFFAQIAIAQKDSLDYRNYHRKISLAEEMILLKNDSVGGLLTFDSVFHAYDFVFVDDCIEAFQLALLYKQDDLAMRFIKKAMDNGFRLENLKGLDCGCPHNFYADKKKKVVIFDDFINKNKKSLQLYEQEAYAKYLKKINLHLLQELLNRHIIEQIYKDFIPAMGVDEKEYEIIYKKVSDSNLAFVVSQFKIGNYIGEKSIGILDKKLLKELGIIYLNQDNRLDTSILKKYNLPKGTSVPVCGRFEQDYFGDQPLYIILYHNDNSYSFLEKYKDEAIRQGYLHPREYTSLKLSNGYRRENRINNVKMKLDQYFKKIENTAEINRMREEYLLPKYEVDFKKHELMHKYGLKLFFGFFDGTK